jgi:type I restriction enzyme, S subunit
MPNEKSKIYITIQFLNEGKEVEYIDEYSNSVCCVKDDVLMTRTGNTGIIVHDVEGVFHNNFFKINFDKKQVVREFLIYYLKDKKTQRIILDRAGTSTIPDLNHNDFYSIPIPLPPTKAEQTAITTALSDADALITSLEKLIAKKQNIKQGAMQQLLTPKENWVTKKLGDFLEYEQPTKYLVTDTEYNDNNNIPVLTAGKTFILGYTHEEFGVFKNIPVIIFDDFTTATQYVSFPFKAKSSAMKILKKKTGDVDLKFVFEMMQRIDYPMGIGDHKRHWIADYQFIEIKVPPTKEEQNAISIILSDMDAEIAALEKRLTKAQKIKQAMMQQLLTGKIRLV